MKVNFAFPEAVVPLTTNLIHVPYRITIWETAGTAVTQRYFDRVKLVYFNDISSLYSYNEFSLRSANQKAAKEWKWQIR